MARIDYEKYLVRRPNYEVFGGVKNRQSPTMTIMSSKQVPEANVYMEPGWIYGIPEPNPSLHEHMHAYDEIVMHWGSDYKTPQVLGGEVEFYVGGQPVTFNTTNAIYLPRGTSHGPVTWKKFSRPHMQMAIMLGTGSPGEAWESSGIHEEKGAAPKAAGDFDFEQYVIRSPLRETAAGFIKGRTSPALTYMSSALVPGVKYYIEFGWTFGIPVLKDEDQGTREMVHEDFDEIIVHIGGDPDNPEDLGGEVECSIGDQPLAFDTTSALYIPRGVPHTPVRLKKFRKPHIAIAIMIGTGTYK